MALKFRDMPTLGPALERWIRRDDRVCKTIERALNDISERLEKLTLRIEELNHPYVNFLA